MEIQWALIVFTLFCCLGAGIFAIQGLLVLLGQGEKLQMPALVVSLASIVIGGIASFLHLQHWDRIFNGFGHLSSGITQELIAIAIFGLSVVLYFFMLRKHGRNMPKWCGVLAIVVSVLLIVIMAHSYNMASRPIWDTVLLELFYLGNMVFLGGLGVMGLSAATKETPARALSTKIAIFGGFFFAIVTAIYAFFFTAAAASFTDVGYYYDPTNRFVQDPSGSLAGIATGEYALLFWLGIVLVGLVVPLVLAFMAKKADAGEGKEATVLAYAGIALVAAVAGSICFRYLLYVLGFSVFVFY